jgi:steroid delta-isomerase-like uncharacterized protein
MPPLFVASSPDSDPLSRRGALVRLGAGGLGFALAGRLSFAAAQSTPTAIPTLLQSWADAWNSADPVTAVAALYAGDGVYEDVPTNTRSAPGQASSFLAPFVKGVSAVKVAPSAGFASSDWGVLEYLFTATNQGAFPGQTGGTLSVRIATVFELSGGNKIRRSSDYYDLVTILTQLGVMPAAGGATPIATPMS